MPILRQGIGWTWIKSMQTWIRRMLSVGGGEFLSVSGCGVPAR